MDRVSPAERSRVMAAVPSQQTSLERTFAAVLRAAGLRGFGLNARGIQGRPDIVFRRAKVAVFVDACFWHACRWHCRRPASNREYWDWKMDRNRRRDRAVNSALRAEGWKVVRVWEHQLADPPKLARAIVRVREAMMQPYPFPGANPRG
ncbi:MAG: very short patch repair endonuclease [Thermoflexales bacterium]